MEGGTNEKPRIGVIGLGRLGGAIAGNLIGLGFSVAGYRRSSMADFVAVGGKATASPAELAAATDVMLTILPDEAALEEVVSGPKGILTAIRPDHVLIELSTMPIPAKERVRDRLAAAGAAMLDCPLSGNPDAARARQAAAFVSGEEAAMARVRPVIEGFTDRAVELGAFGNGSRMKYLANMLLAVHCMAAVEAFNAGLRVGMAPELVAEALNLGAAASRQLSVRAPVVSGAKAGAKRGNVSSVHSEFPTIAAFLHDIGAKSPLYEVARRYYEQSVEAGFGTLDTAMIYTAILRAESAPNPATPPVTAGA